jgi:hypothetical protein
MKSCTIGMPQEQRPFKSNIEIYKVGGTIYRSADYQSMGDAVANGAAYTFGAYECDGRAAYDIFEAMCAVAVCLEFEAHKEDLRGDVVINDRYIFEDVSLDEFGLCISSLVEGSHI